MKELEMVLATVAMHVFNMWPKKKKEVIVLNLPDCFYRTVRQILLAVRQ
jgi:hypothetical protein